MKKKEYIEHEKRVRQFLKKQRRKKTNPKKLTDFYKSHEWKRLRYEAFKKYGNRCMCCGATPADGYLLQVDHIKPIGRHPKLALDIDNLQILCSGCNWGKYGDDETNWRAHMDEILKHG